MHLVNRIKDLSSLTRTHKKLLLNVFKIRNLLRQLSLCCLLNSIKNVYLFLTIFWNVKDGHFLCEYLILQYIMELTGECQVHTDDYITAKLWMHITYFFSAHYHHNTPVTMQFASSGSSSEQRTSKEPIF